MDVDVRLSSVFVTRIRLSHKTAALYPFVRFLDCYARYI